jgi:NDP-sugar pyrophosphorylase family protein
MQCIILAGGLGSRIRALSAGLPKSLIPVLGKPFLDYQLAWLSEQGIENVILAVGFKAHLIIEHIQRNSYPNLTIEFVKDGEHPLGTAGAIRSAIDNGLTEEAFFVLYGDSYLDVDLRKVWEQFQQTKLPTMTVFRNDGNWDTSNVLMQDNKISLFEKNREDYADIGMKYIDYGISILPKSIILKTVPSRQITDLADVYHDLSLNNQLLAFEATNRFFEIGSPTGHADLERYLALSGKSYD